MATGLAPSLVGGAPAPGPAPSASPEQPMPPEGGAPMQPGQGQSMSPEDSAAYEGLVANSLAQIYAKSVYPGIAASFVRNGSITSGVTGNSMVEELAGYVSAAVGRSATEETGDGQNITSEMTIAAAGQIAQDIGTEMAQSVTGQPLPDEQIQAVWLRSLELLEDQREDGALTSMALRDAESQMQPQPQGAQPAPQAPGGAPPPEPAPPVGP